MLTHVEEDPGGERHRFLHARAPHAVEVEHRVAAEDGSPSSA